MDHKNYLYLLHQLSFRKKAQCVVQGSVIFVESTPQSQNWQVSSRILDGDIKKIPRFLKNSLTSKGILKWQERGAYLRLDPVSNHVYLIQDVKVSKKYVPFKYLINDFVQLATEWKNMIENITNSGEEFLHIG
ncbi:MAG: hypothetical protein FJZ57_04710 [Chlamydiae bacterium]|nr:hypothetical protein [Chlamydiota bacterium]